MRTPNNITIGTTRTKISRRIGIVRRHKTCLSRQAVLRVEMPAKSENHLKRARKIGWDTIKARFQNDVQYREQMMRRYKFTDRNIDDFEALSYSEAQQVELPWTARSRKYGVRKRTAVVGMEDRGVWEQVQERSTSSQSTWRSNWWWSDPYTPWRENKSWSEHRYQ